MLTIHQYQILNSCVNGYELFYYPFAEVNYRGQVFSHSDDDNCALYDDDHPWEITVSAESIIEDITNLIRLGYLECQVTADYARNKTNPICSPEDQNFTIYSSYSCLLLNEHIDRFGYGPHEFRATDTGIAEIYKPIYEAFDKKLDYE